MASLPISAQPHIHRYGRLGGTMDELLNPFSPGAGSPPPALIGRDNLIHEATVLLARVKNGKAAKSLIITGLRGVGKTVLLNELAKKAQSDNYHVIAIEADENNSFLVHLIQNLRGLLLNMDTDISIKSMARKALSVLKSFSITFSYGDFTLGVDIDPCKGTADSGLLELDLPVLFSTIGAVCKVKKTGIALIVNEVQFLKKEELSALILTMHKMQQMQLPVVLISAGLPVMYELAGETKSYAERLFSYPNLQPLSCTEAKDAIRIPIKEAGEDIKEDALQLIYEKTKGYPYFLQEWGYRSWNVADASPIRKDDVVNASSQVIQQLDENFFKVRFNRVTHKEREFLHAMATLGDGPCKSSDVATVMHKTVGAIGPLRGNLIKKGMIYSPEYGMLDFTVPLFGDFMLRVMAERA